MLIETDVTAGFIEITVDGDISVEDYESALRTIDEVLAKHDRVNFVEVVRRVGKIPVKLWFRDLRYVLSRLNKFGRCAVVTDKGWIAPLGRVFSAFTSVEIRTFPLADLEPARAWARGSQVAA